MPALQLDLDEVLGGRCCWGRPDLRDDLYGQKARLLWRGQSRGGVRREPGIAQPREDQIRVHRVAPRHLGHRNTRRSCLEADRPLLIIRPKPLRPTRHAITIVSTIDSGHYPALSPCGRAVRPDGYLENAASIAALLITTEAMVAQKPKEAGAGSEMSDMGGMM